MAAMTEVLVETLVHRTLLEGPKNCVRAVAL